MKVFWVKARKPIQWILLGLTFAYVITGISLTNSRLMESITFGILTKPIALRIHSSLLVPFLIFLVLHIFILRIIKKSK